MENATFRKWLAEHGCRFDTQHKERSGNRFADEIATDEF